MLPRPLDIEHTCFAWRAELIVVVVSGIRSGIRRSQDPRVLQRILQNRLLHRSEDEADIRRISRLCETTPRQSQNPTNRSKKEDPYCG